MSRVASGLVTMSLLLLLAPLMMTVTGRTNIVELNVVVDDLAYVYWKQSTGKSTDEEFIEEIESTVYEASELYKSLPDSFEVRFVLKNLTIHAVDVVRYNPYGVVGQEGLTHFEEWMNKKKKFEKTDWDVSVLLTGYDVVNQNTNKLYGFGWIGYVCTGRAIGLVEFRSATYKNAFVLAHEIGHVLGANHDGTYDEYGRDCKPDGHVMTSSTVAYSPKHFYFSHCSYLYFYYHFTKVPWDCMKNGDAADFVQGKRLGTLMTADQACKRDIDQYAFVRRASYSVYGDEVCTSLWCDKGNGDTVRIFSPPGLYCGKNKQCIREKCVETDEGRSDVSDECPFGDQPEIDYKGYKSCDDLPLVYCGSMKHVCCKRCNIGEMGVADRMCRQIKKTPKAEMYRKAYAEYGYGDNFCKWLACTPGRKEDGTYEWKWETTPPGIICGKNKRCLDSRCLPANYSLPYLIDGCPFGDQGSMDCPKRIEDYRDTSRACKLANLGADCCAYCNGR